MYWYLVYTKPRQEKCALYNLQQQDYECYMPTRPSEKIHRKLLRVVDEPLFPRYLFVRLGHGASAKSWLSIRSTRGVSHLVRFGIEPAKVDDCFIELLRKEEDLFRAEPVHLFRPGDSVCLNEGPFKAITGLYQISEGGQRVMILLELLGKQTSLNVDPVNLRKVNL